MGFFDSLMNAAGKAADYGMQKLEKTSNEMHYAQDRASDWSDSKLESKIRSTSNFAERAGYMKEYKNRHDN